MRLKILSLNIWAFFYPLTVDNIKRIKSFVQLSKRLSPDIINLQEIYNQKLKKLLCDELNDYYSYGDSSRFISRLGLVTLSKMKFFAKPKIREFKSSGVLPRGYLITKYDTSLGKLQVINTHLTLDLKDKDSAYCQFDVLRMATRKCALSIVSGDFNLEKDELKDINQNYFVTEDKFKPTILSNNTYQWRGFNRIFNIKYPDLKDRKLDYVLAKSNGGHLIKIRSKVFDEVFVSDHQALLADISIK